MENCIAEEHLIGMLDRDQRTAKVRYLNKHVAPNTFCGPCFTKNVCQTVINPNRALSHSAVPGRASPHSSCKTRKNGYFWKSLQRLKHVLIVIVYITIITFPSISSAPLERIKRDKMSERMNQQPKWINPCGTEVNNGGGHDTATSDVPKDFDLKHVIYQTNVAYNKAKHFKTEFVIVTKQNVDALNDTNFRKLFNISSEVQKSFNMDADSLHNLLKSRHYDWLPSKEEIPKELGESVPQEHLEQLEPNNTLLDIYGYLQKIAVGLEQIAWDEEDKDKDSSFAKSFNDSGSLLRTLLCELQNVIAEHNLTMRPDITRDIMTDEFRNLDNTDSNIRNWLIFRDYMNLLEYSRDVFSYFKSKMENNA